MTRSHECFCRARKGSARSSNGSRRRLSGWPGLLTIFCLAVAQAAEQPADKIAAYERAQAALENQGEVPDSLVAILGSSNFRVGITSKHDWYDERPMPTVSRQELVARCEGAERVRCTIEATPTGRVRWLDVQPRG